MEKRKACDKDTSQNWWESEVLHFNNRLSDRQDGSVWRGACHTCLVTCVLVPNPMVGRENQLSEVVLTLPNSILWQCISFLLYHVLHSQRHYLTQRILKIWLFVSFSKKSLQCVREWNQDCYLDGLQLIFKPNKCILLTHIGPTFFLHKIPIRKLLLILFYRL